MLKLARQTESHFTEGCSWFTLGRVALLMLVELLWLAGGHQGLAAGYPVDLRPGNRKALIMGYAYAPGTGESTHAHVARNNFLSQVGNPKNDPANGWTCDFTWDLMLKLGLDPTNTSAETLFAYIGTHRLGYRIAMNCGPFGFTAEFWEAAVDNGIMPFAPQGGNARERYDDPMGLRGAVGVAGGVEVNETSWGSGVEFLDSILIPAANGYQESPVQSWASQVVAARFARVLDAHPNYNIWDARQHLRQAGRYWATGWNETNGYGRINEKAVVGKLLPGPPVNFLVAKSRNGREVAFSWRNFLQRDYAATVLARQDGRVLYRGTATHFAWTSDVDGAETFVYWSENRAGEKSRIESYQRRMVNGLSCKINRACLVVGAHSDTRELKQKLCDVFQQTAPNWIAEMLLAKSEAQVAPLAGVTAPRPLPVLPSLSGMIEYAVSNRYRILLAPVTVEEGDLFRYKAEWDRAADANVLVVLPHHSGASRSRRPLARRLSPPRLFSGITVGVGMNTNLLSFGPGLEFFDVPVPRLSPLPVTQMEAAAVIAGKLARILDENPQYNAWDARQHLRQSASNYAAGWCEDGGYGRPPEQSTHLQRLDPAPPLDIRLEPSADGKSITFTWRNFCQSSFAATVVQRRDGRKIYEGSGSHCQWQSDVEGEEVFRFFSKDKAGRLSREEVYTRFTIGNLHTAAK